MKYLYPNFVIHDSIVGRTRLSFHHRISRILSKRVTRSYSTQKTNILPDHVHLETSCALFPKRLDKTAKPMRNQRRMGKKKWWNLKVEGLRSGQSFASVVGACACVCSTGECPPLLGFGWDFLVNPSFPRPSPPPSPSSCSQPSSVQRWRERNEEKERAEWKCRRESEWLGERERSIFETPVPLGTELLSPPHAQWRSKGGQLDYVLLCLFPGYSTNGSLGQRGGAL